MKKLLLALLLCASPAMADMSLPPAKYDIGGNTIEEAVANFYAVFGEEVPIRAVAVGYAQKPCDEISWPYYHAPWPAPPPGESLYGCSIAAEGYQAIVYSYGFPGLDVQIFRHEVGHLLGWSAMHERD